MKNRWQADARMWTAFVIIFACLCVPASSMAKLQGKALIDSLGNELSRAKEDTNKVNLLNTLANVCANSNPDEGLKYGQQGLALAEKLAWKAGKAAACRFVGLNLAVEGDFAKAESNYLKALALYTELKDNNGIATVTKNLGNISAQQGDYPKALAYFEKALKIYESTADKRGIAALYNNIGVVYKEQGNFPKALDYYLKSNKANEELGEKAALANGLSNAGIIYMRQSDYPRSLEYFYKALKISEELDNKGGIAMVMGNLGIVYGLQLDLPRSLDCYVKAQKAYQEMGDKAGSAHMLLNIGNLYNKQTKYEQALDYHLKALTLSQQIGDKPGLAASFAAIGMDHQHLKNYSKALENLFTSLSLNREMGDQFGSALCLCYIGSAYLASAEDQEKTEIILDHADLSRDLFVKGNGYAGTQEAKLNFAIYYLLRSVDSLHALQVTGGEEDCYKYLAQAYKLKGDYKKALESFQNYTAIKDSVFTKENDKKIMAQQMQYDYDKKEAIARADQEKKELLAKTELQKQKSEKQFYIYILALVLVIAAGATYFVIYSRKVKRLAAQAEMEHKLQLERERISRDLHDNVGTQLSLMNKNLQHINNPLTATTDNEKTEQFKSIELASKEVIDHLRETIWAINKKEITLVDFSDKLKDFTQKQLINFPSIILHYTEQLDGGRANLGPAEALNLFRICQEGLTNSIKYANATQLSINISATGGKYKIAMTDNGMGFKLSDQEDTKNYGLKNMAFRASEIACSLEIDTDHEQGTSILISKN